MIHRQKKFALILIMTSVMMFWAPSSFAEIEVNLDVGSGDADLDTCSSVSDGGLSGSLGCDSGSVIDLTEFSGDFDGPDSSAYDDALTQSTSARDFIQTIVNYALSFLGLFAIIMVIYGGVLYVLSRGDEEMATKGKKTISYAAVGIIIVLGSFAFVNTLIGAGGGGGASDSLGSGTDGTTITDAGADFDVEDVLVELEDIAKEYVEAYEVLVDVKQEVAYMNALDLPYILTVETETKGTEGFGDKLDSALSGEDWDSSQEAEYYDTSGINTFINEMIESVQDVQIATDNLSDSYFEASQIYTYFTTGDILDDDLLSRLLPLIFPSAYAENYVSEIADQASPGSCADIYDGESFESGAHGEDVEETKDKTGLTSSVLVNGETEVLYERVCKLIEKLDVASEYDFVAKMQDLSERMSGDIIVLFETGDISGSSGSKLGTINEELAEALAQIDLSETTINIDSVQTFLAEMDDAYTAVQDVKFVSVVLDVSVTSGNAPLLVAFDVVGTEDPSGETVLESNIEWDLNGDGFFNDVGAPNPSTVESDYSLNGNKAATGYSVSGTYDDEGSYRVRVRVKSEDDDIAAGISGVTVNVDPRRSKIVLYGISNDVPTPLADFRSSNQFEHIDEDSYRVTATEAEAGVSFDISESTDGNGDPLVYVEWDFGDTEISEGPWGGDNSTPIHYYDEGTYEVSVTVTDNTGAEDRKFFSLYVGSPAARIDYSTETGVVGTEFKFDGSGSSTDVGTIVSYSWSITGDDGFVDVDDNGGSTLAQSFDKPGVYTVQLQVSDGSSTTDDVSVSILVESTPPIASFECEVQDESAPGTLTCDGTDSYDPDDDDLFYSWDFDGEEGEDYELLAGDDDEAEVIVRYLTADDYDIALTVTDDNAEDLQKSATAEDTYRVSSVLEISMELEGDAAKNLNSEGTIDVLITGTTTGSSLEIDCGNSTSDFSSDLSSRGEETFVCTYTEAGIFNASITAYDEDGNSSSDTIRVYIGGGDEPIAIIDVDGNGEDIGFDGDTVYGNVDSKFTFDGSSSVNTDGSSDSLSYSWNFGNGKTASSGLVTTSFDEIAVYTVTLTVRDKSDNTITSETSIDVEISPIPPEINGITVVPQGDSLETPIKVSVSIDAKDDDGSIEYVKAWYYDLNDTAEDLGTVISQSTEFSMTLNTNGEEGDEVSYGFAVEITDSDNMTVNSFDELESDEIPSITVVNGSNDSPVAAFSVDRTSIFIGEEITFINESYDPDGDIVQTWWDIGADGAHNDDPVEGADSLTYQFTQIHPDGVEVRLKVEDSAGATTFSDTITIYVDTLADAPDARFLSDIDGTTVNFTNNSDVDEENGAEVQGVYWDFDLSYDSDGNGEPDDDFDSFEENPSYTYEELGVYQVMMTIVDTTGQTDTVSQDISVIDTDDPVASFSYDLEDKQVTFKNASTVDTELGVDVRSYVWDFDLDYDADGDGDSENDADSLKKNPTVEYDDYGSYEVSLTVEDTYGKIDVVQVTVEVSDPVLPVEAVLTAIPQPNSSNQIVLGGTEGEVTFFFSAEGGSGTFTYQFDKNIFYDTNLNDVRDDDIDYADEEAGTWTTEFFEAYGTIVVQLTVTDDETGESDIANVQVVFSNSNGGANLLNATPQEMMFLILSAVLAAIAGVALVAFKPVIKS
jgi:PKD repeat protein